MKLDQLVDITVISTGEPRSAVLLHGHFFRVNLRGVLQGLPEPNRAWLLGNHSLTPVASGRPLVYQVTLIIPYKETRGRGTVGLVGSVRHRKTPLWFSLDPER